MPKERRKRIRSLSRIRPQPSANASRERRRRVATNERPLHMSSPLQRLGLLALSFAALVLAGCGGDSDAPVDPHVAQVQAAAASGVAQGLVGAAAGLVTPTSADTATAGLARVDSAPPA